MADDDRCGLAPCDNCGAAMRWETSHQRCDRCGHVVPCCEGAPLPAG